MPQCALRNLVVVVDSGQKPISFSAVDRFQLQNCQFENQDVELSEALHECDSLTQKVDQNVRLQPGFSHCCKPGMSAKRRILVRPDQRQVISTKVPCGSVTLDNPQRAGGAVDRLARPQIKCLTVPDFL